MSTRPRAGCPTLKDDWQAEMRNLQPNWDSYGGRQISESAISAIESFCVVPLSNGGIQLEVHLDGFDVEISVNADGRIDETLIVRTEVCGGAAPLALPMIGHDI